MGHLCKSHTESNVNRRVEIMNDKKNTSYPKEKVNVLFLENISDSAIKLFKDAGYSSVRKLTKALSEDELVKEIKDVHLLGIRSKTQITAGILEAARKLQTIGCFCIGVNQVDLRTGQSLNFPIGNKTGRSLNQIISD